MTLLLCLALLASPDLPRSDKDPGPAIALYEHGDFQGAAESLSRQVRTSPAGSNLLLWLGKSYYKLRKWDDAIRQIEKAVQMEPANCLYHLWLGRSFGKKAEHANFIAALGPARRVVEEFETAVKLCPDNLDARFDLLEFYLEAPGMIGGGKDKARAQIGEIARISPRLRYSAQARYYEKEKKWDLVLRELTQTTIAFPKDSTSHQDLAGYFFQRSDFRRALDAAQSAIERNAGPKARLIAAASQIRLRQNLSKAEQSLRNLVAGPLRDEDPAFEEVHYWLGEALLAQSRKTEARQSFELALRFNPDYEPAKATLAQMR